MNIYEIIADIINEIWNLGWPIGGTISVSKAHIYYEGSPLPYEIKGNDIFKYVDDDDVDIDKMEVIPIIRLAPIGKIQISKKKFNKLLVDAMLQRYLNEGEDGNFF